MQNKEEEHYMIREHKENALDLDRDNQNPHIEQTRESEYNLFRQKVNSIMNLCEVDLNKDSNLLQGADQIKIAYIKQRYTTDKILTKYTMSGKQIVLDYTETMKNNQMALGLSLPLSKAISTLIQDLFNLTTEARYRVYQEMSHQLKLLISQTGIIQKVNQLQKANPQQRSKLIKDSINRAKLTAEQMKKKHKEVIKNRTTFDNSYQTDLWNCNNWGQVMALHQKIHQQFDDTLIKHFLRGYNAQAIKLNEQGILKQNLKFMLELP